MAANHLTTARRREIGRRVASQRGHDALSASGKLGYKVTWAKVEAGEMSPVDFAAILSERWGAFDKRRWDSTAEARARQQAQKRFSLDGARCECPQHWGCPDAPLAACRDHINGIVPEIAAGRDPNRRANVQLVTVDCHRMEHRRRWRRDRAAQTFPVAAATCTYA